MTDIDNIDILFYLKMLNYKKEKETRKKLKNMDSAGV